MDDFGVEEAFESSVVLDGTKTIMCQIAIKRGFESSVVLDGTKTMGYGHYEDYIV